MSLQECGNIPALLSPEVTNTKLGVRSPLSNAIYRVIIATLRDNLHDNCLCFKGKQFNKYFTVTILGVSVTFLTLYHLEQLNSMLWNRNTSLHSFK